MNRKNKEIAVICWMNRVAGKAKVDIIFLLLIQAALGISSVIYAMFLREMVNSAVEKDVSNFYCALASFICLVIVQIILRAFGRFLEEFTRVFMENRLKERIFQALLTKEYASVVQIHSGEWMNRLTSDTAVAADGFAQILPGVTGMAVKMFGAMGAMLCLEPQFAFVLVPGGIFLIAATYGFRKNLKVLHKKIQEADGRLRIFFQERLENMIIVRTFSQEVFTGKRAVEYMEEHGAARMRRNHLSNICNIGFAAVMNGAYILGAAFCGYGILKGTISYGNLIAVTQLISQIQNPLANISGYLPKFYAMTASAERMMELDDYEEEGMGSRMTKAEVQSFYREEFLGMGLDSVTFTYRTAADVSQGEKPSVKVLRNLNIEIKKGEYAAFTGPSGCGKSTVLKLLMCLYPVDAGERYLMTLKGRRALASEWRALYAYVPQGNQLMAGTIREIIAFGNIEKMYQEEKLEEALTIACAGEFVSKLENGVDTFLGERGIGLSEGQMQRLAIARAVFTERPILLLDEATSSLDEETEKNLLGNLRTMTDKTVIIVTHRMAALKICDKEIKFA